MRIYYAHAKCLYGREQERMEIDQITSHFPGCEIIDPGDYQENPLKTVFGMDYCLRLVESCDSLVFSRLLGKVTAGVGKEVNHALTVGKPVYELTDGQVTQVLNKVRHVSIDRTVALYDEWKKSNGRPKKRAE